MKLLPNSIALFTLFISTALLSISAKGQITVSLNGGSILQHQVRTPYTDPGVTAKDADGNIISSTVELVSGPINVNILGVYQLVYQVTPSAVLSSVTSGTTPVTVMRTVKVVDAVECMLHSLPGSEYMVVDVNDANFAEPTVFGSDNYYPTVSITRKGSLDISKLGTYTVTYTGVDGSGNTCTYIRTIKVTDRAKPILVCKSATIGLNTTFDPMTCVSVADNYFLPADFFLATNGCKLDVISNNVDPTVPGTYQVCYQATDGEGNVSALCCAAVTVSSQTMGITEGSIDSYFTIYPNPTAGNVEISLNHNTGGPVTIKITTIRGQTIKTYTEQDITNGKITADLSGETGGIYFVEIKSSNNVFTKKLVLSK